MIKGLEVLQEIKSKTFSWEKLKDSLDTIEKELNALEIIKNRTVDMHLLKVCRRYDEYNWHVCLNNRALTQEEYDLLKEVLL